MKKIKNLDDLKLERFRLETLVIEQKQLLRSEVITLKKQINPFSFVEKWKDGLQHKLSDLPLGTVGVNQGVDLIVRDKILHKSNWMVRMVVPFLLKNAINFFAKRRKLAESKQEAEKSVDQDYSEVTVES
jgi:hypothetical protein